MGSLLVLIGPAMVIAGLLSNNGAALAALIFSGLVFGIPSVVYGYRVFRGTVDPTFGPGTEPYVLGLEHLVAAGIARLRSRSDNTGRSSKSS
ncbi:MAG: hypothetical protein E6I48_13135 [Chloroflexi bacterium]|nr:MAG: hypothetical protein E6I48_13135 [Chloroflexota bacterium]